MPHYLLDTNAVIAVLNKRISPITRRIRTHRPMEVGISSIVAHELYYGAFKSQRSDRNVTLIDDLQFQVLEFDKEDARQSGDIRAILALKGLPIGAYDVLIAGQAKARNITLITHNTREFSRIPGLKLEDWESAE